MAREDKLEVLDESLIVPYEDDYPSLEDAPEPRRSALGLIAEGFRDTTQDVISAVPNLTETIPSAIGGFAEYLGGAARETAERNPLGFISSPLFSVGTQVATDFGSALYDNPVPTARATGSAIGGVGSALLGPLGIAMSPTASAVGGNISAELMSYLTGEDYPYRENLLKDVAGENVLGLAGAGVGGLGAWATRRARDFEKVSKLYPGEKAAAELFYPQGSGVPRELANTERLVKNLEEYYLDSGIPQGGTKFDIKTKTFSREAGAEIPSDLKGYTERVLPAAKKSAMEAKEELIADTEKAFKQINAERGANEAIGSLTYDELGFGSLKKKYDRLESIYFSKDQGKTLNGLLDDLEKNITEKVGEAPSIDKNNFLRLFRKSEGSLTLRDIADFQIEANKVQRAARAYDAAIEAGTLSGDISKLYNLEELNTFIDDVRPVMKAAEERLLRQAKENLPKTPTADPKLVNKFQEVYDVDSLTKVNEAIGSVIGAESAYRRASGKVLTGLSEQAPGGLVSTMRQQPTVGGLAKGVADSIAQSNVDADFMKSQRQVVENIRRISDFKSQPGLPASSSSIIGAGVVAPLIARDINALATLSADQVQTFSPENQAKLAEIQSQTDPKIRESLASEVVATQPELFEPSPVSGVNAIKDASGKIKVKDPVERKALEMQIKIDNDMPLEEKTAILRALRRDGIVIEDLSEPIFKDRNLKPQPQKKLKFETRNGLKVIPGE